MAATITRPDTVDEILGGDQAVMLANVTPASGVVLTPLTNFGIRDREAGRMTPLSSSVGLWRKLERLQRNPRVAVAYHTRRHGFSERAEYVLVQGEASLSSFSDRNWIHEHREAWERFAGPVEVGWPWERWTWIYHWRVGITIAVKRLVVWPDLACRGAPEVHGAPLPAEPPEPQLPPKKGTGPRINHPRAARGAARRPHTLLGWVGADGFPLAVPVEVAGTDAGGIVLETPEGVELPPGGRRAGLSAHSFARYTFGQHQHKHTGWMEADPEARRVLYAPHTSSGYWLPESEALFRLASGFETRRRYRQGRRAGFLPPA